MIVSVTWLILVEEWIYKDDSVTYLLLQKVNSKVYAHK